MDLKFVTWMVFLACLFGGSESAKTDAELKAEFMKIVMSCLPEHPLEMNDLMKLRALELPDKREAKCLLACAYRKVGTLRDDGKFDLDKSYKLAESTKQGDETAIANGKKLADACTKVNDENVTDGNKGCDRSGFMFKCVINTAPKFGFTV